jgi:hypothetical protein
MSKDEYKLKVITALERLKHKPKRMKQKGVWTSDSLNNALNLLSLTSEQKTFNVAVDKCIGVVRSL